MYAHQVTDLVNIRLDISVLVRKVFNANPST